MCKNNLEDSYINYIESLNQAIHTKIQIFIGIEISKKTVDEVLITFNQNFETLSAILQKTKDDQKNVSYDEIDSDVDDYANDLALFTGWYKNINTAFKNKTFATLKTAQSSNPIYDLLAALYSLDASQLKLSQSSNKYYKMMKEILITTDIDNPPKKIEELLISLCMLHEKTTIPWQRAAHLNALWRLHYKETVEAPINNLITFEASRSKDIFNEIRNEEDSSLPIGNIIDYIHMFNAYLTLIDKACNESTQDATTLPDIAYDDLISNIDGKSFAIKEHVPEFFTKDMSNVTNQPKIYFNFQDKYFKQIRRFELIAYDLQTFKILKNPAEWQTNQLTLNSRMLGEMLTTLFYELLNKNKTNEHVSSSLSFWNMQVSNAELNYRDWLYYINPLLSELTSLLHQNQTDLFYKKIIEFLTPSAANKRLSGIVFFQNNCWHHQDQMPARLKFADAILYFISKQHEYFNVQQIRFAQTVNDTWLDIYSYSKQDFQLNYVKCVREIFQALADAVITKSLEHENPSCV